MSEEKGSRFAELALELFGAQAASKFVDEIWAAASDVQKERLADAVVATLAKEINSRYDWALRDLVEKYIEERANQIIEENLGEQITARVEKCVVSYTPKRVEELVEKHAHERAARVVKAAVGKFWSQGGGFS